MSAPVKQEPVSTDDELSSSDASDLQVIDRKAVKQEPVSEGDTSSSDEDSEGSDSPAEAAASRPIKEEPQSSDDSIVDLSRDVVHDIIVISSSSSSSESESGSPTATPVYQKRVKKSGRPKTHKSPAIPLDTAGGWNKVEPKKKKPGRPRKYRGRAMTSAETSRRSWYHKKFNVWVNPCEPITPQLRSLCPERIRERKSYEKCKPKAVHVKESKKHSEEAEGLDNCMFYILLLLCPVCLSH